LQGLDNTASPKRPLSATIICCYEFAAGAFLFVARAFSYWYQTHHQVVIHPPPAGQVYASYVSYGLALCAAFLLWSMNRAAAPVLIARAILTLGVYIFILFRVPSTPSTHQATMVREITHALGLAIVLVNALIAWHIYRLIFKARPSQPAS
jgi:hypothetical protein